MSWAAWDNSFVTTKAKVQENNTRGEQLFQTVGDESNLWARETTTNQKVIEGLTLAGAEDGAAYIRSTYGDEASVHRQNDANAYYIRWTEESSTPWTTTTTTTT